MDIFDFRAWEGWVNFVHHWVMKERCKGVENSGPGMEDPEEQIFFSALLNTYISILPIFTIVHSIREAKS